jgi:hypothetical protein
MSTFYLLEEVDLNKKDAKIVIPQACNHPMGFTIVIASTKQPFHSIITGQAIKNPMNNANATMPTNRMRTAISFSMIFP